MTEYHHGWPYPVAFPPHEPETTLAQVISEQGERQLHVAETEKYAHVTYFFDGGKRRVGGGGAAPGRLAPRRPDLRPEARDERRRGRRRLHRGLARGRLPLRDHQLRQPRHGRPHRRDPGRVARRRGRRPRPRRGRRGGPCAREAR